MAKIEYFTALDYIQKWAEREIGKNDCTEMGGGGLKEGLSAVNHKISGYGSVRLQWFSGVLDKEREREGVEERERERWRDREIEEEGKRGLGNWGEQEDNRCLKCPKVCNHLFPGKRGEGENWRVQKGGGITWSDLI